MRYEDNLEVLRDVHKGERFIVLGCGPSISRLDVDRFSAFVSLGSNSIGKAFEPTYYSIFDPVSFELFGELQQRSASRKILPPWIEAPADYRIGYRTEDEEGFSRDCLFHARSSGFINLGLAFIMGASEIHTLGIDGYDVPLEKTNFCETPESYRARSRSKWTPSRRAMTIRAFSKAANVLERAGIPLINHSPSSFLCTLPGIRTISDG